VHGIGWMTKEGWADTSKIFVAQGVLKSPIDLDKVFTDKYLANANALKR
jgi:hypothetical protein